MEGLGIKFFDTSAKIADKTYRIADNVCGSQNFVNLRNSLSHIMFRQQINDALLCTIRIADVNLRKIDGRIRYISESREEIDEILQYTRGSKSSLKRFYSESEVKS